jgi:predicted Zn-dependent protease
LIADYQPSAHVFVLIQKSKAKRPLAPAIIAQAAIIFVAVCVSFGASAQTNSTALPNLGDGSDMAASAERRLGDRIARELYRDPDYVDDPVIMEYVQAIWQPLLAAARMRGEIPGELDENFAWEILLGRDRTVNAFALPGAYLGLHLGLVGVVTSRDELASVLAHELSHVTQRHISRIISRQNAQAPWMMGAMILAILAAGKDPNAANALVVGGQAASAQNQLNFSRDMEREADRVGFGVMTQAGFEPQGFVGMFEKLQQASRLNDTGGFPYLRSHPLTTERMADMQARIGQASTPTGAVAGTGAAGAGDLSLEHAMVSARARVLSNGAVDALRNWATQADAAHLERLKPAQQAGVLYGATFAALKLRDFASANALLTRLGNLARSDAAAARLVRLLAAELALAQNDGARALKLLADSATNSAASTPAKAASRAELFLAAQASLQAGQAAKMSEPLQVWVAAHPRDAQAWQLLSSVYAAQGRSVGAVRAEAEVYVAQLDFGGALTRLKVAQDMVRAGAQGVDHIEASIVDTRTRQVQSAVREQAAER